MIVDDDEGILEVCRETLEKLKDVEVFTERSPKKAISEIEKSFFDIVIADIRMPEIDGIELARRIKELSPSTLVIMMTAYPSLETAIRSLQLSAYDYLIKPFTPEHLIATVKRAVDCIELRNENVILRSQVERKYEFKDIVFRSAEMSKILEFVRKIAPTDCEVLITGESGVGKELIARQIHKLSGRKDRKFVAVNLGAIPENLIEAELFGYEKGAFTGASSSRVGLIEYADGGTLFLDEISEVSQDIQVKLLRVIQEKKIRRLGSNREIKVDVRIISATNKNIDEEVKKGNFREDLFYRINVFRIHIPPLRERKEDIRELITYYMKKFSSEMGIPVRGIEDDALSILLDYSWPGNVRELQNVVKRAVVLAGGERPISIDDLPDEVIQDASEHKAEAEHKDGNFFYLRKKTIEEFEKNYLVNVLRKFSGNVNKAREYSEIPRATFYRMLKKYRINPAEFKTK